ncbi:MAG TPA: malto-oligosyltrehalose trehalohydrolase [Candidatus Saccharimonadales bacterium]|nr:malto-oligosyltrehalose trehalohydrolase [Candidatus Saccharimonadales bacterium]
MSGRRESADLVVWAPRAERVELVTTTGRIPLRPDGDAWFRTRKPPAGTDYQLSLDGGEPLPDPRSAFQPAGPQGPSRVVDHDTFGWTDGSWQGVGLADLIIYELHIGTFTPEGTFDGAIARLDDLVDLGVTAIELLPVAEFPGERGWGYDGVDLYAPHHAYGGPDGLRRLVDAAHARGLAVILDVVYNHLGPDGNHLAKFGPYFTSAYTTPWGDALDFDGPGAGPVRRHFIDNAGYWLERYHLDGLRLDAVHAINDRSAQHLLEALALRAAAVTEGPRRLLIAESDLNDPRFVTPRAQGGYGIDAQWSDDLHHAIHALLTGERAGYYADFGTADDLAKALRQAFVYDGRHSTFRGRPHGRAVTGLSGHRFLAYSQDHDQVGNRACGERLEHLVGPAKARIAAALVLLSPFVPMLFQGEEWAASSPFQYFTDHGPELGRLVRDGRRQEFASFGWDPLSIPDPQDPATFERSKLRWEERALADHAAMLAWYRDLIALRRSEPALRDGDLAAVRIDHRPDGRFVVARGPITLALNLGGEELVLDRSGALRLASGGVRPFDGGVVLPPLAVAVLRR